MHDVVRCKLESLCRCIGRIEAKRPETVKILKTDYDVQDIISLNLDDFKDFMRVVV